MAARGALPAQTARADQRETDEQTAHPEASSTGVSRRSGSRRTGSHSVDRFVRVLYFCYEETPNRDVFIDLFPVNPNPWADKSPVGSLCRG
jgi:hypothetical protein